MQTDEAHYTERIRLVQRPKSLPSNRVKSFAKVFTGVGVTRSPTSALARYRNKIMIADFGDEVALLVQLVVVK